MDTGFDAGAFAVISSALGALTILRHHFRNKFTPEGIPRKEHIKRAIADLEYPRVVIPRPEEYKEKTEKLHAGGLEKLQIIADFDRTLTAFHGPDGERGESCHGVIEKFPKLSQRYHNGVKKLFDTYFPIETSPDYTIDEKVPLMEKWYQGNHEMLLKESFHRHDVHQAVKGANIQLRPGAATLFDMVERYQIPFLIFSAGIGNLLSEVIKQKYGALGHQTHIISNWMLFDRNGGLAGFSDPLIHMFNKDDRHIKYTSYYNRLRERQHVILLGDGMGDVDMARDEDHDMVLRIGFLNQESDQLLRQFSHKYDLIILNDGNMAPALGLIWNIAHGRRSDLNLYTHGI
eukprot:gb/GECG01002450.1/.p1 GENE.gb/GECG01002450.1/~~gb/GECG01002450.1/.p1  ORF type:complete len:346 (+),score=29.97 gb/GECG01002450.1/:1-1038(+)